MGVAKANVVALGFFARRQQSRATPEPTQLLENPKRYPLNEDTFFLLAPGGRFQSEFHFAVLR